MSKKENMSEPESSLGLWCQPVFIKLWSQWWGQHSAWAMDKSWLSFIEEPGESSRIKGGCAKVVLSWTTIFAIERKDGAREAVLEGKLSQNRVQSTGRGRRRCEDLSQCWNKLLWTSIYSNHSWAENVDLWIILQGKESDLRIKRVFNWNFG